MDHFVYLRPTSVADAVRMAQSHPGARALAGGQSLLPAMRLGLNAPTHLIDLQDLAGLHGIRQNGDVLQIGALVTHAEVARSATVHAFCPMLATLAAGIADEQVRSVGTIGGSLANNDPAACWPAGVLALGATLVTDRRELPADAFFQGLYATALAPGELLVALRFHRPQAAHYLKLEQPASRFALVGRALARLHNAAGVRTRVALTGLGLGVRRWADAERALDASWSASALDGMVIPPDEALGDLHASAEYRAHLAGVLVRRAVAGLTGETAPRATRRQPPTSPPTPTPAMDAAAPGGALAGSHLLPLPIDRVWHGILDPDVLCRSIPGCEQLQATGPHGYDAVVKVGLGPMAARFTTRIQVSGLQPPVAPGGAACLLQLDGQAGGMGGGQARAQVTLTPVADGTRLDWQARTQVSGRIAQFGNRLIEASARTALASWRTMAWTAAGPSSR